MFDILYFLLHFFLFWKIKNDRLSIEKNHLKKNSFYFLLYQISRYSFSKKKKNRYCEFQLAQLVKSLMVE